MNRSPYTHLGLGYFLRYFGDKEINSPVPNYSSNTGKLENRLLFHKKLDKTEKLLLPLYNDLAKWLYNNDTIKLNPYDVVRMLDMPHLDAKNVRINSGQAMSLQHNFDCDWVQYGWVWFMRIYCSDWFGKNTTSFDDFKNLDCASLVTESK